MTIRVENKLPFQGKILFFIIIKKNTKKNSLKIHSLKMMIINYN